MLRIFIKTLIVLVISTNCLFADKIKKITVIGNERISKETIILFSDWKANDEISVNLLNETIKKLYATDYFDLINIDFKGEEVIINVKENKIIQTIEVYGVTNKKISSDISEIVKKDEKTSYLKDKIQKTNNQILNLLRSLGFYFAEVSPKIIENDNNSVDIIYDIKTGVVSAWDEADGRFERVDERYAALAEEMASRSSCSCW